MREMTAPEFVRRLKDNLMSQEDARYAFFIGAGCSVSSGIPAAKDLVWRWLEELKTLKGSDYDAWLKENLPDYDKEQAGRFYPRVIEERHPDWPARQAEMERIVSERDPGFGYAVLAQLLSHANCGHKCNIVLTTNFDDLVADSLYLYTNRKPRVIVHEALAGFIARSQARPLVVKLHGDARLYPKNTVLETAKLDEGVSKAVGLLLKDAGLVFLGYGGNDASIALMLDAVPPDALKWGVSWVGSKMPDGKVGEWLMARDATWVKHRGFDELMLTVFNEFSFKSPDDARFRRLLVSYQEAFKKLSARVNALPADAPEKVDLQAASEKAAAEMGWFRIELAASAALDAGDAAKASEIYENGIKEYPKSAGLLGHYAWFQWRVRRDSKQAEGLYRRAMEADSTDLSLLNGYATFLWSVGKNYEQAEGLYKRAVEVDPGNAVLLNNYATFLWRARKDYEQAEAYYKRAIESNPKRSSALGNYAVFLAEVRKQDDQAKAYHELAIEADPKRANDLANYAQFLLARGDYEKGMAMLERALDAAGPEHDPAQLECWFYRYAHEREPSKRAVALGKMKALILKGVVSNAWDLSVTVARAEADGHQNPKLLRNLALVIPGEIPANELSQFEEWKKTEPLP